MVIFGLIAVVAVGYGFLFNSAAAAGRQLQHGGYYAMCATFAWWLWALVRVVRPSAAAVISQRSWQRCVMHAPAIWLILSLTIVAGLTVPYSYKVLYDEAVLQSTAFNLHFFREFGTVFRGYEVEGVFRPLTVYLDKRPFFFPFAVSLVHDLTGYRSINANLLNTVLLPVVLGLFYWVGVALGGRRGALAGTACFGASALLAQNANGAGMEMLNLAMLLLTVGLAVAYLRRPDERGLAAMVLSCVLLAQSRYESVLYVVPVAVVVLIGWRRAGRVILPVSAIVAPLLLVPAALQHTYLSGTPLLWELREDVSARFGWEHLGNNLQHAVSYFLDLTGKRLNAIWLSCAGFIALTWALWSLIRGWRKRSRASEAELAVFLFGLTVAANLGLLMLYFWGQLDDPIVSRLALPFHVVLGFAIAWAVGSMPLNWKSLFARCFLMGALITYLGFGLRATAHHNSINQLAAEMSWEESWVAQRADVPRFIITNKTALNWMLLRVPTLAIELMRGRMERLKYHWDQQTFREVLVFQYYRPVAAEGGFVLDPRDRLDDSIILEPLHERQIGGRLLRVSRVIEIREKTESR